MTNPIRFRQVALDDIDGITQYLEQFDPRLANRFEDAIQETAELVLTPGLGRPIDNARSVLHGARFLIPTGFRNYVLYYIPEEHGISILRVLHGSRDIERIE